MAVAAELQPGEPILQVRDLATYFFTRKGVVRAVDGFDLHVKKGETLAIVGESGSGKTVAALSFLRLVPSPPGRIVSGQVYFQGKDLLQLKGGELRRVRGSGIALILQEPMSSLNPALTMGQQIIEAVELSRKKQGRAARDLALEMLRLVQIPAPESRFRSYPHELSGGMKQRVMIAMALACRPQILIADEPTASLDVTIQVQILELIKQLKEEVGTTVILISHDLGVVAEMADRVVVVYAGQVIETAGVKELFHQPVHPYTQGIVGSILQLKVKGGRRRLSVIPGQPPTPLNLPAGCRFHPRCVYAKEVCGHETPGYAPVPGAPGRWVRCHYPLLT